MVNTRILSIEIVKQSKKVLIPRIKPLLEKEFIEKRDEMLDYFDRHEVTQDLLGGPEGSSSFVNTEHGGNLYSLLGFPIGVNPTDELRDIIRTSVRINLKDIRTKADGKIIEISSPVFIDELANIHARVAGSKETSLPWTTRSFTDLLERGVTGFSNYLFDIEAKFKNSFSTTAIETKNKIRGEAMNRIRYVSDIIAHFRNSLNK